MGSWDPSFDLLQHQRCALVPSAIRVDKVANLDGQKWRQKKQLTHSCKVSQSNPPHQSNGLSLSKLLAGLSSQEILKEKGIHEVFQKAMAAQSE